MKNSKTILCTILVLVIFFLSCHSNKDNIAEPLREFIPDDKELYETIVSMDRVFFDAYNSCDLKKQDSIYADNIEFYHDKGGLMTSKQDIIDATEKNICDKVTRELVKGSIEVYPIKDYGAVEIGFHKFHNNQEPDAPSNPSKFIIIWQNTNNNWQIAKVISLH